MKGIVLHKARSHVLPALIVAATLGPAARAQRPVATDVRPSTDARRAEELLARPMTIDIRGLSRIRAVDSVAVLARVRVQYLASALEAYPGLVTVRRRNVPLRTVLEQILAGTSLRVTADAAGEVTITESASGGAMPRQGGSGVIVGLVIDSATGQGLPGVTVAIQGAAIRATTSAAGAFRLLDVPAGSPVLRARRLGYQVATQVVDVRAGDTARVRLRLVQAPTALSGVVTTATGQQRKLEVGNDITTINADSVMKIAPVANLTQLLENRVPGLTVVHTSGSPGDPSRIRLRGASSITGSSDPIFVVDGVRQYADQAAQNLAPSRAGTSRVAPGTTVGYARPSPLDQIDPNSIETVEVLKGPSAAAMYGSDAANGVIVITTKRGRAGPTHWSTSASVGRSAQRNKYPMGYYWFAHYFPVLFTDTVSRPEFRNDIVSFGSIVDSVVPFQALNDARYSPTAGHGTDRAASLTVSGGSPAVLYSVTGSASDHLGQLKLPSIEIERFRAYHAFDPPAWVRRPDHYTTWGGTSALTFQLGQQGGTLALTSGLLQSDQQRSSLGNGQAVQNLMGRYIDTTQLAAEPLIKEYFERARAATTTLTNGLQLNYPLWRGIPVSATLGLSVSAADDQTLTPRDYVLGSADSLGRVARAHGTNTQRTLAVFATLPAFHVGGPVTLRTVLGVNAQGHTQTQVMNKLVGLTKGSETQGIGCDEACARALGLGSSGSQGSGSDNTYGWYIEPQLNFGSRFFANPGIRFDGGSSFGTRAGTGGGALGGFRQFLAFPKLNFSWLAVDRAAGERPLLGVLTQLRPRIAVGRAGQQPTPEQKLRLVTSAPVSLGLGGGLVDGAGVTTIGNTHLRPERSNEVEGGVDAILWGARATIGLTGYRKTRFDALLSVPLAPSVVGGPNTWVNIGTVRNTGVEASASVVVLDRRAVQWVVGGQVASNANVVVQLAPGVDVMDLPDGTRIVPGYPLFGRWARPILAVIDYNGDGTVELGDYYSRPEIFFGDTAVYVGQEQPKYTGALNTDLTLFGRLRLHTEASLQRGLTQLMEPTEELMSQLYNDPAAPLARQAAFLAALCPTSSSSSCTRTNYGLIQRVNMLRWESLSVSYALSPAVARRLFRVPQASLALQGANLGLKTNYRGLDPNVNAYTGGGSVLDAGQLPLPRTWQLRFTLGN